jgi:bacterioferritin-associated ferredoxin
MKIDTCLCFKKSFKRIYKESIENGIDTLEDLQNIMNICNKCKLCNPYIDQMYKTGETTFNQKYELEKN